MRVYLKSPVREHRTPGSVRGRSGDWPSYRMKDRLKTKDLISSTIQFLLVVVGAMYTVITLMMWSRLGAQLRSSMDHSLTAISNIHNFRLLEFIF
jgi:hypothetical protein